MQQNQKICKIGWILCILFLYCGWISNTQAQAVLSGTSASSKGNSSTAVLGAENYQNACTTAESRTEILRRIPFKSLTPYAQERVRQVLQNITIYRRLPVQIVPCEKSLYDFMTFHPDTMVSIWRLMGVSQMELQELQPGQFYMEDQAGTRGKMECLYRTNDIMLIYAFGTYEGIPFPKKVSGSGLIVLQNAQVRAPDGSTFLAIRLDAFMQIHNEGVETIAKTFKPLVGKVADHNLNQVAGFLGELSQTSVKNGEGVAHMAQRLDKVSPEVKREFADVALKIGGLKEEPTMPLPVPYAPIQEPKYSEAYGTQVPQP